jgi:hypothetical protein
VNEPSITHAIGAARIGTVTSSPWWHPNGVVTFELAVAGPEGRFLRYLVTAAGELAEAAATQLWVGNVVVVLGWSGLMDDEDVGRLRAGERLVVPAAAIGIDLTTVGPGIGGSYGWEPSA